MASELASDATEPVHTEKRGTGISPVPRFRLGNSRPGSAWFQLHPLVVPQDSQTKQEPAGRMRTPQVEQKGASTADIPGVNASSLRGEIGATVGVSSTSATGRPSPP
jgi:hypothetical protein